MFSVVGRVRPTLSTRTVFGPLFVFLALLAATTSFAAPSQVEHRLEWSPSALTESATTEGVLLGLDGATPLHVEGKPVLPRQTANFVVPRGMRVVGVTLADAQWIERGPRALMISTGIASSDGPVSFDRWPVADEALGREATYPAEPVVFGATNFLRGYSIGAVEIVPVRVRADGVVEQLVSARVQLELEVDPLSNDVAQRRVAWPGRAERDAEFVRAVVRNGADVERYAPPRGVDPSVAQFDFSMQEESLARVARLVPEPVDFLIITTEGLRPELERLAAWRTQEGLRTSVVTVDQVNAVARPGGDVQETLRNYVRTAHEQWGVDYLLLAGDAELLPPRYARSSFYPLGGFTEIPTDLYFACLDGNWNLDADALYAEPYKDFINTGDQPDMLAELAIGRAPVKSLAQAAVLVDKIIEYENPTDRAYAGRALFLSEVLFPQNWDGVQSITLDGATYAEDVVFNSIIGGGNLMQSWRMYENFNSFFGSTDLTKAAALDSMDTGRFGLVNHVGHGFYYNASVGDDNIFVADALTLQNDNPFFLHALNCSSGAFDFDCLLESFIQDLDGGAVGTVGSSRAAFPSTANVYQQSFFARIFVDGVLRAGDAQLIARSQQVSSTAVEGSHRWTHLTYHLFSDPTLRLWREEPKTATVTHAASVNVGAASLTVQVNAGAGVSGATVALTRADGGFAVQTTAVGGQAILDLRGLSDREGILDLVVSGKNLFPYRTVVAVQPTALAHVRAQLDAVDDDGIGASDGDGDTVLDAGEVVELVLSVENNGGTSAAAVEVALVAVNAPGATIVQGSVVAGTLNAGVTTQATGLVLDIDPTVPDGTLLDFELVSTSGGSEWRQPLQLEVKAPEVEVARVRWDDSVLGNGDGVIQAGETVDLFVEVVNYGGGTANVVTGTLGSASPNVTILDSTNDWSALGVKGHSEGSAGFRIVESDVSGENWLQLQLVGDAGQTWTHDFELRPPTAPVSIVLNTTYGPDRIALEVGPSFAPHFAGYRVYRRNNVGEEFAEITTDRVLQTGFIMDLGLESLTRYTYRVTTVDSSGVESAPSPEAQASTAPPEQAGGFPLPVTRQLAGAIAVGNMKGDGTRVATFGADWLYAIDGLGNELLNGDDDSQTIGPLAGDPSHKRFTPSGVSMADLDGDGHWDLVGANWETSTLWVVNHLGEFLPGWPRTLNARNWAPPVIADLDNDGDFEIVVNNVASTLYVFHHDGTEFRDGDNNPATTGIFQLRSNESFSRSTPAVFDVDGDQTLEIIFGTVYRDGRDNFVHALKNDGTDAPGWPKNVGVGGWNVSAVTVADLYDDGNPVIMLHTEDDLVRGWHPDGSIAAGFPHTVVTTAGARDSRQPAVTPADFDQDGVLELVVVSILGNSSCEVIVMEPDGTVHTGWPRALPGLSESSPVVGDINGDGQLDLIFGIGGGSDNSPNALHAFNRDGTDVQGFPITLPGAVRAVPVITDFNSDGDVDIVYAGFDLFLHAWDMPFPYDAQLVPWPTFQGNARRTGVYGQDVPTAVLSGNVSARPGVGGILLETLFGGAATGLQVDVDRRRSEDTEYVRIASGLVVQGGELIFVDAQAQPGETYVYRLTSSDGSLVLHTGEVQVPLQRLAITGAVPNPFNPRTEIQFEIPGTAGAQVPVRLELFDVAGRRVRTLHVGPLAPGAHRMTWDGQDDRGMAVSSGTYFARLQGVGKSESLKVTLLK